MDYHLTLDKRLACSSLRTAISPPTCAELRPCGLFPIPFGMSTVINDKTVITFAKHTAKVLWTYFDIIKRYHFLLFYYQNHRFLFTEISVHREKNTNGFTSHIMNTCYTFQHREKFSEIFPSLKNLSCSSSVRKMRWGLQLTSNKLLIEDCTNGHYNYK